MIQYDKINSVTFRTEGDQGRYICSCCGQITTLSDSVSSQGYNLVCNRCRYIMRRVLGIKDELSKIQAVGCSNRVKEEIHNGNVDS